MALHPWFDRTFTFDLPLWIAPNILERLRGTAARAEDRLRGLDPAIGIHRTGNAWSVQQHIGHLGDLEPLWMARVEDLRARRETLVAADLQNRVTDDAILEAFDAVPREAFVPPQLRSVAYVDDDIEVAVDQPRNSFVHHHLRSLSVPSSGRSSAAIASRARKIRERTVPIGQFITLAISS